MAYFILLKPKKAKRWTGAIPARKGANRSSLQSLVRRSLSKRYVAKVITGEQMNRLLKLSRVRLLKSRSSKKK